MNYMREIKDKDQEIKDLESKLQELKNQKTSIERDYAENIREIIENNKYVLIDVLEACGNHKAAEKIRNNEYHGEVVYFDMHFKR